VITVFDMTELKFYYNLSYIRRKATMKSEVYIEFYGEQLKQADVIETAKKIWKDSGRKPADLKKLDIYVKPEDDCIYYVFNGEETGSFGIAYTQSV